jgi:hypothetical protein
VITVEECVMGASMRCVRYIHQWYTVCTADGAACDITPYLIAFTLATLLTAQHRAAQHSIAHS